MGTVFHLALASDWQAAQDAGAYTVSTRGRTLADEGFIHASRGDQWPAVRDRFYADVTEQLLLLKIDTARLDVPVVDEPGAPGSSETFPHIYGPLPLDAVVRAIPVTATPSSGPVPAAPAAPAPAASVGRPQPDGSFAAVYFREMFVNAGLVCVAMLAAIAGIAVGYSFGDVGGGVGGIAGAVLGGLLARWLYVRRHGTP